MLCLPYAFWSVCLLRCYFGSQTWNHPNSAHPVFLCFLSVWTWALGSDLAFNCDSSLSYSEVPSPPAQCFSSWRNLGPIYKWFVQNSVLLHKQFLCSRGTSASRSSRNPLPLQGAKPVGQGGHTSLTSWRRTYCWTFLRHVPQWMSTTKWLVLTVSFLGTEVPCWQWTQP